ncbi:lariat debranching enzyme C-terminal domain-containing protein [Penicillium citrinum]|uniref:Lariat debranching enzyme C-terminal domain-containing protein n=1 Tax=Penicillium citrinum TaxID=5077 RepID=A0A9W9PEZ0_PENCI|nr:lariat debranching enzyme C-terminal domain-containing protein [Penicillium citrinum]KAJ5241662.1 lariat debranching enzyme C-terminal domain-containing protein [Penicillium citrinum]
MSSVPSKYRKMGDYHEYYSGQRQAPYLTIFCGGNHEASNHLFELYHGGWIAHNIYYLAPLASFVSDHCVSLGCRVSGRAVITGSLTMSVSRTALKICILFSMSANSTFVNFSRFAPKLTLVFPTTGHVKFEYCGDYKKLFPAFAPPPAKESPRPRRITPPAIKNKLTKFLALDKPNNHDRYFRLLDLAPVSDQTATDNHHPYRLQYDREWLAITRVSAGDLVLGDQSSKVPADLGGKPIFLAYRKKKSGLRRT